MRFFIMCYINQKTNLYFRGARIFVAVMEDLLSKGMENAEKVWDIDDFPLPFFFLSLMVFFIH